MGRDLSRIVDSRNEKLRKDIQVEFLRSGIAIYGGCDYRMGGFWMIDDCKPENLASLDLKVGIVDYGRSRVGETLYSLTTLIKAAWGFIIKPNAWMKGWNIPPFTDDKAYSFDAIIDIFTALEEKLAAKKNVNSNYRIALGIDILRRILEDPYDILPDEVKVGLNNHLKNENSKTKTKKTIFRF